LSEEAEYEAEMRRRSRSFDAWALEYDRYRPTYPQEVFDYIAQRLALPAETRVADLGAGTGKAARQMARRGWNVTAVEPGVGMLDVLRARAASEGWAIDARLAGAEETGLPSAAFDLATAAQAFHWFDKPRAVPEMARIVRPGGGVAVFWNSRADDRSAFLADHLEISELYLPARHVDRRVRESTAPADLSEGGWFEVDERVEITHEVQMTPDEFVGYVFTASQIRLFVEPADQERLRADLRELISRHFGADPVLVPYDVDLYVGRRSPA
jgi:SAM-dependent methyltransferase